MLVGGFNWSPKSIEAIKNKKLEVVLGGHFIEAGIAVMLLYDHLNNFSIARNSHARVFKTKLLPLTYNNNLGQQDIISYSERDPVGFLLIY